MYSAPVSGKCTVLSVTVSDREQQVAMRLEDDARLMLQTVVQKSDIKYR